MEFILWLACFVAISVVSWRYIRHVIMRKDMFIRNVVRVTSREYSYWSKWFGVLSGFFLIYGVGSLWLRLIGEGRIDLISLGIIFWGVFFLNWPSIKSVKQEWCYNDEGVYPTPYFKKIPWKNMQNTSWSLGGKEAALVTNCTDPISLKPIQLRLTLDVENRDELIQIVRDRVLS